MGEKGGVKTENMKNVNIHTNNRDDGIDYDWIRTELAGHTPPYLNVYR